MLESIPLEDVFIPLIAKYLSLKDLLRFRCCSRECKFIAEKCIVNFKCINFANKNSKFTRKLFIKLVDLNSGRLLSLNLSRCHWLTDEILKSTLVKCHLSLREVIVNDCENLTSVSIQPLIIKCKELRILKMSNCQWVTTGSLDALTLHHSNIEDLDLSYCHFISTRCLTTMFRKFSAVRILNLEKNPNVTNIVLSQLASSCPQLTTVNLSFCDNISDFGIQ